METKHNKASAWHRRNRYFAIKDNDLNKVDEVVRHSQHIRDIADQYAQSNGLKLNHNIPKAKVNPDKLKQWKDKLKKHNLTTEDLVSLVLAKIEESDK